MFWSFFPTSWRRTRNVGRGKKITVSGKDMVFVLMKTFNNGGELDVFGMFLKISGPTFEWMISRFFTFNCGFVYFTLLTYITDDVSMDSFTEDYSTLFKFPEAIYTFDINLHQVFTPSGSWEEGKIYFSSKHNIYGFKVEFLVLPNCLAARESRHYTGYTSDFDIFHRSKDWNIQAISNRRVGQGGEMQ